MHFTTFYLNGMSYVHCVGYVMLLRTSILMCISNAITMPYTSLYNGQNVLLSIELQTVVGKLAETEQRMEQMERGMRQMERMMEEMRIENKRAINIGEEMNQEHEG